MTNSFQTTAYKLNAQEGQNLRSCGATISIKATSMQTGGAFNLFEALCPPAYATPLHIHYAEHVALYVLEGSLAVFWGGEKKHAAAGSYFFQPQGTPHGFRVEGGCPARILYITFPAGFDRFIAEETMDVLRCKCEATAARYKVEILGPLPE